jgi:hypothetical protein
VFNRSCWFQKFGVSVGVVLACLSACSIAKGVSSASLQWNANTDPSVVGYKVYYGGASRSYTNTVAVGNRTTSEVGGLLEGKVYYFAVTAYDVDGFESDYSEETTFLVPGFLTLTPGANPGDPTQIKFSVEPGHSYELQVSTDLVSWTTTWQTVGTSNTWAQFDAPKTNADALFYRVVLH